MHSVQNNQPNDTPNETITKNYTRKELCRKMKMR